MARKISMTLSTKSIDDAIKQLEAYRDSLDDKTERFVDALLDKGIKQAEEVKGASGRYGSHQMEKYVTFSKELDVGRYGVHGVMVGMGETLAAEWLGMDGDRRSGAINSLAALEWGTAGAALPATEMFGGAGGQGTNAKYGHEGDLDWYFITGFAADNKPIWKRATAITPTRPMWQAANVMLNEVASTAKEVFKE